MNFSGRIFARSSIAAALLIAVASQLSAADKPVVIAFTPTAAAGGIFNAQAEGFFAKRGLENLQLLTQANGVGVVAAVQSGSAQIGSVAIGVFSGAVENGLDYVAIGCQSLFGPGTDVLAVIARNGETITKAKDFEGKRVAVPGINGAHHIMFLKWLKANGADASKVTFLEVSHAQQADVLRGKSVDAVVTAEPNVVRITKAGLGTVVSRLNDMKDNLPDAFFITTRKWADANPDRVAAFQQALADGVAFAEFPSGQDQRKHRAVSEAGCGAREAGRPSELLHAGSQEACRPSQRHHVGPRAGGQADGSQSGHLETSLMTIREAPANAAPPAIQMTAMTTDQRSFFHDDTCHCKDNSSQRN